MPDHYIEDSTVRLTLDTNQIVIPRSDPQSIILQLPTEDFILSGPAGMIILGQGAVLITQDPQEILIPRAEPQSVVLTLDDVTAIGPPGIPGGPPGPIGPPGPEGEHGVNAYTLNTAGFTVPAIGATAVVYVEDTSWIVIGQFLYVGTAGGAPDQPGALKVVGKTDISITLQNISTSIATGPPGPPGPSGQRGSAWYNGTTSPPGSISGQLPGDYYLNTITGETFTLT